MSDEFRDPTEAELKAFAGLRLEDIKTIYLGAAHKCYCGCAGTYRYPKANPPEFAWQGEVNDTTVNQRFKRMVRMIGSGNYHYNILDGTSDANSIFTVEFGNDRALTLYTKKGLKL